MYYIANVYNKSKDIKIEFKALTIDKLKELIVNKIGNDKEGYEIVKIYKAELVKETNIKELYK